MDRKVLTFAIAMLAGATLMWRAVSRLRLHAQNSNRGDALDESNRALLEQLESPSILAGEAQELQTV